MNEKEKAVNEFFEALKIQLEQALAQDANPFKRVFHKDCGDKIVRITMSVENK